jgi:hypothetical protein
MNGFYRLAQVIADEFTIAVHVEYVSFDRGQQQLVVFLQLNKGSSHTFNY